MRGGGRGEKETKREMGWGERYCKTSKRSLKIQLLNSTLMRDICVTLRDIWSASSGQHVTLYRVIVTPESFHSVRFSIELYNKHKTVSHVTPCRNQTVSTSARTDFTTSHDVTRHRMKTQSASFTPTARRRN